MTDQPKASGPSQPEKSKKDIARERSAAALRENLKRRKAKTRSLNAQADDNQAAPDQQETPSS